MRGSASPLKPPRPPLVVSKAAPLAREALLIELLEKVQRPNALLSGSSETLPTR